MIYSIKGTVVEKNPTFVVMEVGGIGFGLHISLAAFEQLGDIGSPASLLTYLHVREDILQLFGFCSHEERQLFLALIGVVGVGPKLAIGILSGIRVTEFCDLIRRGDAARIKRIPGIGPKTAERLVVELRSKVDKIAFVRDTPTAAAKPQQYEAALLALQSLGYKLADAQRALDAITQDIPDQAPVEDLIKKALQKLL